MFVQPEEFPETPFDSISSHSGPISFLNDQTQSVVFEVVDGDTDSEMSCPEPATVPLDPCVFGGLMQPLFGSQSTVPRDGSRPFLLSRVANLVNVGFQTVNRFRPFARRRLMTSRPARVDMRSRKPCVRFLFRLLG